MEVGEIYYFVLLFFGLQFWIIIWREKKIHLILFLKILAFKI